jgi:superfamily II DNA/RNA helicase
MGVYLQRSKSDVREDMPENTVTSKDVQVDKNKVQDYFNMKIARRDPTKKLIPIVALNYMRESLAFAKSFESAKDAISILEKGKKIAMFTAFQSSINKFFELISEYLKTKGKRAAQIIGGLSDNERNKIVEDFKDPNSDLVALGIGIKAGGTGMDFPNVTDQVIVNDFDWTAASADQLEGRFFRIISNSNIETRYSVASDPTDQMLFERLKLKRAIANKIRVLSSAQVNLIEKGFKQDSKEIKAINKELAKALKEEKANNENNRKKDAYILSKHYNDSLAGQSDEDIARIFSMFDDSEVHKMAEQIANNDLYLDERIQKIFAQRILTVKEGPKKRGRPKKNKEASKLVPIIKWT